MQLTADQRACGRQITAIDVADEHSNCDPERDSATGSWLSHGLKRTHPLLPEVLNRHLKFTS
jgi:hypothetical protein